MLGNRFSAQYKIYKYYILKTQYLVEIALDQ